MPTEFGYQQQARTVSDSIEQLTAAHAVIDDAARDPGLHGGESAAIIDLALVEASETLATAITDLAALTAELTHRAELCHDYTVAMNRWDRWHRTDAWLADRQRRGEPVTRPSAPARPMRPFLEAVAG